MTKPREKNREELQAEIEDGKKKIRQLENREKVLRQKLSQEERRTRSHRLIVRGAVFESIVPEAKTMTDEEAAAFHKGRTYTPLRVRALCRGLVGTERKPLASLSDRHWRLCRNKGLHPLRRLRGYPCTPTKTVYQPLASVPFLRVFILSGR